MEVEVYNEENWIYVNVSEARDILGIINMPRVYIVTREDASVTQVCASLTSYIRGRRRIGY